MVWLQFCMADNAAVGMFRFINIPGARQGRKGGAVLGIRGDRLQ
ncbi:MAG: hypothetical protein ACYC5X_04870 [Syntrophales bacterium]